MASQLFAVQIALQIYLSFDIKSVLSSFSQQQKEATKEEQKLGIYNEGLRIKGILTQNRQQRIQMDAEKGNGISHKTKNRWNYTTAACFLSCLQPRERNTQIKLSKRKTFNAVSRYFTVIFFLLLS